MTNNVHNKNVAGSTQSLEKTSCRRQRLYRKALISFVVMIFVGAVVAIAVRMFLY